jgi:hypothetical protein
MNKDSNVSRRNSFIVIVDDVVELKPIFKREEFVSKSRERTSPELHTC